MANLILINYILINYLNTISMVNFILHHIFNSILKNSIVYPYIEKISNYVLINYLITINMDNSILILPIKYLKTINVTAI